MDYFSNGFKLHICEKLMWILNNINIKEWINLVQFKKTAIEVDD